MSRMRTRRGIRPPGRRSVLTYRGYTPGETVPRSQEILKPVLWGKKWPPAVNPSRPFHWMGIRKDWATADSDLIGSFVCLPPRELGTHVLIVGRSGSGKTVLIGHLMAQDIALKHSIVVLDLRGDLVAAALELCAGRVAPSKIAIFDLRDPQPLVGYSPLFGAGPEYVRALAFLAALESEHDHLGVQLAETLRNAALLFAECKQPITLFEALFYDEEYRQALIEQVRTVSVRDFWQRYSEMSKEKQAIYAMPALNKVSILNATSTLRGIFGANNPIDLGKHLDTPGSVTLISCAVDQLSHAGRTFGNLMLASVCREIFARASVAESKRNPVRLYVDECHNFSAASTEFEGVLAEGRRFKFSLLLAHQVLAQLTPKMRSLVLNGVGTKIIFATGREDGKTLSLDLTGDQKALDLTCLCVGEAFLWQRSKELIHFEVNRPLIQSDGLFSPTARAYLEQVRAHWTHPDSERTPADAENIDASKSAKSVVARATPRLEDWL